MANHYQKPLSSLNSDNRGEGEHF